MSRDKLPTRIEAVKKKLAGLTRIDKRPCIHKVHKQLHDVNEKAYKPVLLAIGPFNHHGKVGGGFMEEHKLHYLQHLLDRTEASVEKYMTTLSELEETARKCYVECNIETDEFVEMMLLALGFFARFVPFKWNVDTSSYNSIEKIRGLLCLPHKALTASLPQMVLQRLKIGFRFKNAEFEHLLGLIHTSICISILDMEIDHARERQEENIRKAIFDANESQKFEVEGSWESIPFGSELRKIGLEFNTVKKFKEDLYKNYVRRSKIPNGFELLEAGIEFDKAKKFKNLLHQNKNEDRSETGSQMDEVKLKVGEKFLHILCLNNIENWKSLPHGKELREAGIKFNEAKNLKHLHALQEIESWNIHGATELQEAGIKLKKVEKCNSFSIKFNSGIIELSPLTIGDQTEAYLRNLIAYEQYCDRDKGFNYVNDYVCFMDFLINSPKDVELLRQIGIIHNYLGDDEVVSSMVNKLGHNINISTNSSIYARTSKEVNMHCRKSWNRWMEKLRHDYFNTPWAWISFLAAVLLLGLTIAQTIFSIIFSVFGALVLC